MPRNQKPFKYDVVKLIDLIKVRPCLWDKTLETYKDRVERRTAWEEIFSMLEEEYETMAWEEKRPIEELILNKWTNIRDTFVKSLKTKMGKPKKKYFYYDNLKFLIKVVPEEEWIEETDESYVKQEVHVEYNEPSRRKSKKIYYNEDYEPPIKVKKSDNFDYNQDSNDNCEYETLDAGNDDINFVGVSDAETRVMNEDEAFFASLLPTVVKYNEDDRLEFRIEVLAVMKRIKDKKNWPGDD